MGLYHWYALWGFSPLSGNKAGYPLSPFLFALALEPLANLIRLSPEVRGLRVGTLEKKLSLYADDALLYLNDAGPYLLAVVRIFDTFGVFWGIWINWTKSILFPIDDQAVRVGYLSQLGWVGEFRYLGVQFTRDLAGFHNCSLLPLLSMLKKKCTSWFSLPLNLLGRINLIKMMLLPKFNYIFQNCPVWVPKSFFLTIECCVSSFICNGATSHLAKYTLSLPTRLGGLALPNLEIYFWATVLMLAYWWFQSSISNAVTCLAFLGSLSDLRYLVYQGPRSYIVVLVPTCATWRVWKAATWCFSHPNQLSPAQPLWVNLTLTHLHTIPDTQAWPRFGVKALQDFMPTGSLLTYSQLSQRFRLPDWMSFSYLQLYHAFRSQILQGILESPIQSRMVVRAVTAGEGF